MENVEVLLVRPERAARMIACGRTKIYELLREGEIRSFKVGTATMIEIAEISRWIERQKASAA